MEIPVRLPADYDNAKCLSQISTVDDPDVAFVITVVVLKPDKKVEGLDSFVTERALLKHIGSNLISWFNYCRDNQLKTL